MRAVAVSIVLLSACKQDNEIHRRTHEDVFEQVPSDQVDVLWVVDNSPSMADEQAEVASDFGSFIGSIEASGLDFHVGVITTDMDDAANGRGQLIGDPPYLDAATPDYEALFEARVQVGTSGSGREQGIDAAYTALTEPLKSGVNDGFLRAGAALSIIYVSDENDCSDRGALDGYPDDSACYDYSAELVPLNVLVEDYEGIKTQGERVLVSALVGPDVLSNCDGAVPGFRYLSMAQAFGGIEGDICQADYSSVMDQLGLEVSGVQTSFRLTYPAVPETLEVLVDELPVMEDLANGWSYDEPNALLYFHGAGIPPRGSEIVVRYEVASGPI